MHGKSYHQSWGDTIEQFANEDSDLKNLETAFRGPGDPGSCGSEQEGKHLWDKATKERHPGAQLLRD